MRIALTGNPNSGKTTMFNALTGRNEHVGNWAGVTVDRKEALMRSVYTGGKEITAVDLPGAYSMMRSPAVRARLMGYSFLSTVTPAQLPTFSFLPVRALNIVVLPLLGFPANAILICHLLKKFNKSSIG